MSNITHLQVAEDLKRSGLTTEHAKIMRVQHLSPEETKAQFHVHAPSYRIPYFDVLGNELDFARARILDPKAKNKYMQPKGSGVRAYLYPEIAWNEVAINTEIPIIITEGEKKAACACVHDLPAIGLGGVWSFKSKHTNLIDDLARIEWTCRSVEICFDSDEQTNSHIQKAMQTLGKILHDLGAHVFFVRLPAMSSTGKTGLDDFLVASKHPTKNVVEHFESLPRTAFQQLTLQAKMNECLAVDPAGRFIDLDTRSYIEKKNASTKFAPLRFQLPNGKIAPVLDEWEKWIERTEVQGLTYRPGEEKITKDKHVNVWRQWGTKPQRGNTKPFLKLFDFITQTLPPDQKKWFLQWLAYPLQYPGTKLYSAVVLHSTVHGTGKSFLGLIMGDIYGHDNFSEIGQTQLTGSFNTWAKGKAFILGDELTGEFGKHDADRMKAMITRERIEVNEKFSPNYTLPDCTNYLMTTNHLDAIYMEADDRRYFPISIVGAPMPFEVYDEIHTWRVNGGARHLHYYLLNVDTSDFNPRIPAPFTATKEFAIELNRNDVESWCFELKNHPDQMLQRWGIKTGCDFMTPAQLFAAAQADLPHMRRLTQKLLASTLVKAGFSRTLVIKHEGVTKRFYCVRNANVWLNKNGALNKRIEPKHVVMNYNGEYIPKKLK